MGCGRLGCCWGDHSADTHPTLAAGGKGGEAGEKRRLMRSWQLCGYCQEANNLKWMNGVGGVVLKPDSFGRRGVGAGKARRDTSALPRVKGKEAS